MLKLSKGSVIMPIAGVCPQYCKRILGLVDDVNDAFRKVGSTESTILYGDFNAHIGTDSETSKGVIGKHGDPAFNENIYCSFVVATGSAL